MVAPDLNGLGLVLRRLDCRIEQALVAARKAYGAEAESDGYRGLYIGDDEVDRLLTRSPGAPALRMGSDAECASRLPIAGDAPCLRRLGQTFGLTPFDVDVLVIALAPELDLRYERLYAYLQDDVSRRRPSVDLMLNLLCSSAHEKLVRRARFAPDAPLLRERLVHLVADTGVTHPPLLAHSVRIDEQIASQLLGQTTLDRRLASLCVVDDSSRRDREPADLPWGLHMSDQGGHADAALVTLVTQTHEARRPLRLYFYGSEGTGKRRAAAELAAGAGTPLLIADIAVALGSEGGFEQSLTLLFREAEFRGAILYLTGADALHGEERLRQREQLSAALAARPGVSILAGTLPWPPVRGVGVGLVTVAFLPLDFERRREGWRHVLALNDISITESDVDRLAGRFSLTLGEITEAAAVACTLARWRAAAPQATSASTATIPMSAHPTIDDLFAAARAQSGHGLHRIARKIDPVYGWDDIVLPPDLLAQLREMCQRVSHRFRVLTEWGFERKMSLGKGISALFAGPPGTGKTMAAQVISGVLGLDLYQVDLSGVVSKYIGETEKNLERVFAAAESANAILLFDEADALFGKRSEVEDAHDRYANIEVAYLLQRMEAYEGITILSTNMRKNLDEAFVRRLQYAVEFPHPSEALRLQIWEKVWPAAAPLAPDVDLPFLARQFEFAGGYIRNVALTAAYLAAETGGPITMVHLIAAVRREIQKLGRLSVDDDFGEYRHLLRVAASLAESRVGPTAGSHPKPASVTSGKRQAQ